MVDPRRVRLLLRVEEDLDYLCQRAALDPASVREDSDRLAGVKYVFVTAIGGCLDVAQLDDLKRFVAAEGTWCRGRS